MNFESAVEYLMTLECAVEYLVARASHGGSDHGSFDFSDHVVSLLERFINVFHILMVLCNILG